MDILQVLNNFKSFIHTFVRFLPLGIYSFSYFQTALYKDKRGGILLLGLILNDILGYLYKNYFQYIPKDNCAIFGGKEEGTSLGFLPNAHEEVVAFLTAVIYSNMWDKFQFDFVPFVFLLVLLIVTTWSRNSVGCSEFGDSVFHIVTGAIVGMLFYYFMGKYYMEGEKGALEKEACDLGYNNYKCTEIRDGTVIVKGKKHKNKLNDEKEFGNEEQGWYES